LLVVLAMTGRSRSAPASDRVDELPSIRVTQEVDRASSGALVPRTLPYGFKTLKYAPGFPERFGSLADARAFGERFLRLLQP